MIRWFQGWWVCAACLWLVGLGAGCDGPTPPTGAGAGTGEGGGGAVGVTSSSGGAPAGGSTGGTTGSVAAAPDYSKVVGRWQRTDADYVLEIRNSDAATGRLEAVYLNPNPIRVSRAEASQEGGKTKVFVELQDVGYPGCTYRLTYFPQTDQLYGVYYQAALGQSFDVEFGRDR